MPGRPWPFFGDQNQGETAKPSLSNNFPLEIN